MMNIIGNTCVSSWITTSYLNQQLVNPFTWCLMDYNSCYNLVKYYDSINWSRFKLSATNDWKFTLCVDSKVNIQYVHYHFDPIVKTPKIVGSDVWHNKIWEYIVEKYTTRTKRMLSLNEPPIFVFTSVWGRNPSIDFTVDEQKSLYDIGSPYKIFTSYKYLYQNEYSIPQLKQFGGTDKNLAEYIYNGMKGKL